MYALIQTRRLLAALVAIACLSMLQLGCGDDGPGEPDFEGTYQVIQHTRNTAGCDMQGPPFNGDEFFRLTESGSELRYFACESAGDCESTFNVTNSFEEFDGQRWSKETRSVSQSRTHCAVTITERVATMESGDVRIQTHVFEGEIERELSQDCTEQFVRDHRDELTCSQFDSVLAVPAN